MRAAAMAPSDFPLILYVLAEHRVDKSAAFGFEELAFADWVEPEELPTGSALRARLPGRMFLTKFREQVDPAQVNADYVFTFAAEDAVYRETIVRTVYDDYTWLGVTALLCCGLLILGGVGGGLLLARRRAAQAG